MTKMPTYQAMSMTSCWFLFTSLLYFVVEFVAQHFFRAKDDDATLNAKTKKCLLEPMPKTEEEEEYVPSLVFKFKYQVPELEKTLDEENLETLVDQFEEKNAESESLPAKEFEKSLQQLREVTLSKDRRTKWYMKYFEKPKDPNFSEENPDFKSEKEVMDEKFSDFESDSDSTSSIMLTELTGPSDDDQPSSSTDPELVSTTATCPSPIDESNVTDTDGLESLWEHQDLIEQLRTELKKARAIGLPTILEEPESPFENLKPWKIDEKFSRENPIDELHKFHKSYVERMRKFDILNYQKMYATGFLRGKYVADASDTFVRELRVELETVYVGQMCLSWEFLRWQYEKARALPESDPYRKCQYNRVAGEFQQFQVLVRRFTENERFEGPRIQNYTNNRCVLRSLLQVPVIKDDCNEEGNEVITSEMLEEVMEESIRVFWEFVKADKDESSVRVRNPDPIDYDLLSQVQAALHKKDKKLKDIVKSGNCLVKKFKKAREDDESNRDVLFAQVDLRLVSRVLKMSRLTTDQLVWCQMKLTNIVIVDRKIQRIPCFLPFPCSDQ